MRYFLPLVLSACVSASAAPPVVVQGGGGASGATVYTDTLATIEAVSCTEDDIGFPSDSSYRLVCESDGTWSYFYGPYRVVKPPTASWTAFNSGSAAADQGMYTLTVPGDAGNGYRGMYRARPSDPTSTPYYVEFGIVVPWMGHSASTAGGVAVGFTDGTGLAILKTGQNSSNSLFSFSRFSSATTAVADDAILIGGLTADVLFVRLEEDGTNRHAYYRHGASGSWSELGSGYGRTVTITADSIGFFARTNDTDTDRPITLIHYDEGAL